MGIFTAKRDGYSHWSRRIAYFTTQSNLWICFLFLSLILLPLINRTFYEKHKQFLYVLKYAFTVSITMTALVFCCFLAPFADNSYHVWSIISLFTHVFSPVLAVADFFVDDYKLNFNKKLILFPLLPPLLYVIVSAVLSVFNFDFGRGENYPYFFMNHFSPAGVFGFSNVKPFFIGSFYWITFLALLTVSIALLYAKLKIKALSRKL
ncbi:MAG: hypothetical protein IJC07_02285 [Clostridia bacterium]|nr:hypothetical protein [Clostridia bacterium]